MLAIRLHASRIGPKSTPSGPQQNQGLDGCLSLGTWASPTGKSERFASPDPASSPIYGQPFPLCEWGARTSTYLLM
eukprot:scaffold311829_cov21-Tisochrysis_lutea.AAC.1